MKKKFYPRGLLFFLIILMFFVLSACSESSDYVIYTMGKMSGVGSELAVSARRGIELALEEINQGGGILNRKIVLEVLDTNGDQLDAQGRMEKLVVGDPKILIGPFTSGDLVPAVDFLESYQDKLLIFSPTISADSLTGLDDNILRLMPPTAEQADLLTKWLQAHQYEQTMIIYDLRNTGYTDLLVKNFERSFKDRLSASPIVHAYDPSLEDQVTRTVEVVHSMTPKAVVLVTSAEDAANLINRVVNQSQETEEIQWLGTLWTNTTELLRKGGSVVESMILVDGMDLEDQNESYRYFKENFESRYGEAPTFAAMYSYETVHTLKKAIERAGTFSLNTVKLEIINSGIIDSLQSDIYMDAYGDCERSLILMQIQEGKLRKVQ